MDERMQQHELILLQIPCEPGLECLRQEWSLESRPMESRTLQFWDTFEWGIWFGGNVLYSSSNLYCLSDRHDGWSGTSLCEEQAQGSRRFWQEFETAAMRTALQDRLGLRGLAVVAEGIFRRQTYDLRNEAGKVVCRLELRLVATLKPEQLLLQTCQVLPLRGYESDAQAVMAQLSAVGATPCVQNPLELLLQQAGTMPRRYTLRPEFGLEMATPARDATGRIVRAMLELIAANLPGIINDLDTEFLHDYRICLRKIRSLLSLVKGVYPAEER